MSDPFNPYQPVPGSQGEHAPPAYVAPGYAQAAPAAPVDTPPAQDLIAAFQQAMARIDQLEKQVAQATAGVGADVPKLTGPTHDAWLVDGTHVEVTGAVPTHFHLQDGRVLPVAYAVAR